MTMEEKYIILLEEQVAKLDADAFDLEAWKSATAAILSRLFGPADDKARFIKNIRVEFGSWSLRDNYGSTNPMQTATNQCREILRSAIREIELFGVPEMGTNTQSSYPEVLGSDEQESLNKAMQLQGEEKTAALQALIAAWPTDRKDALLLALLNKS